uniref:Uncharacterized protein n=1 Tax=Ascaris lumbricoides TaxID=6252 RepID=A0A0M3IMW2_ASCLU
MSIHWQQLFMTSTTTVMLFTKIVKVTRRFTIIDWFFVK